MDQFFVFIAILAFSVMVRVLIDRRQRSLGKRQIGWIGAVLTLWLLNSIFFDMEGKTSSAPNNTTVIGPVEWLILIGPPLILLGYLLWRFKLKHRQGQL